MIADSVESRTGLPLELHIQSPSSGLFTCFALQSGFAPMAPLQDPGADGLVTFGVALWSSLPIALPIRKLEVGYNQRKPACLLTLCSRGHVPAMLRTFAVGTGGFPFSSFASH